MRNENGARSGGYRNRMEHGAAFSPLTLRSHALQGSLTQTCAGSGLLPLCPSVCHHSSRRQKAGSAHDLKQNERCGFRRSGENLGNVYGRGSGEIWLHELQCVGNEMTLLDCGHSGWGVHDCNHFEDVSVSCDNSTCVYMHHAVTIERVGLHNTSCFSFIQCFDTVGWVI